MIKNHWDKLFRGDDSENSRRRRDHRDPEWAVGDVIIREERTFEVTSEGSWTEIDLELGLYWYDIKWDDGTLANTTPFTEDKVS